MNIQSSKKKLTTTYFDTQGVFLKFSVSQLMTQKSSPPQKKPKEIGENFTFEVVR
jgi:hypothetical protein